MKYVFVPTELPISEITKSRTCLSPGRFVRFIPRKSSKANHFAPLDKLVMLRDEQTVVKKDNMYRYAEIKDIDVNTGGITFREMPGSCLPTYRPSVAKKGDVLVSTVRTYRKGIGYVEEGGDNLVTTNAVLNICGVTDYAPNLTLLYVYSFLRTDFFVEQVWSMLNRGLYPRMDKGALDKVLIPITSDRATIVYVSALMQAIVEKEKSIRDKSDRIHEIIQTELESNQKDEQFQFQYPTISKVRTHRRMDAAIYDKEYLSKIWLIQNYDYGFTTPKADEFVVTPGPSLEIKILRTRIDSDVPKRGFYFLIVPTNISNWGTIAKEQFLGTAKQLPHLQPGDVLFGESGCHRSLVFLGSSYDCPITTNAHGLYGRREDGSLTRSIFFRCIFDWLYKKGIIDLLAVGGSGGHFSPEYFEALLIPKFPDTKQAELARLYHNQASPPSGNPSLDKFIDWHRLWNANLGIWELDREMKVLQNTLNNIQEKIIRGKKVEVPI